MSIPWSDYNRSSDIKCVVGQVQCPRCDGKGEYTRDMPAISETWSCGLCKGKGLVNRDVAFQYRKEVPSE